MAGKPPFTGVEAQRYVLGDGWVPCEPHRAEQWAVVWRGRVISRHGNKAKAADILRANERSKAPRLRAYKLGQRMGKRT